METQYEILYLIFLLASIHITWTLGKRQGISDTLDYLEQKGDIELDEDWKIVLDKMLIFWYNIYVVERYHYATECAVAEPALLKPHLCLARVGNKMLSEGEVRSLTTTSERVC